MFFVLSKLIFLAIAPSNLIALAIALGLALRAATRYRRIGNVMSVAAAIALLACGFGPVGAWIIRPLEDRFARPSFDLVAPEGIIVLGGAISPEMTKNRTTMAPIGARLTDTIALARRFPNARIVFTGGSSHLIAQPLSEAEAARTFFAAMGLQSERVVYETQSRNTFENAEFTRAMLSPRPEQRWILVTSASHMPRAVGVFRHFGFNVIPWPADYQSLSGATELVASTGSVSAGLTTCDIGAKEWIGLLAYWVTGRTDEFLPGAPSR